MKAIAYIPLVAFALVTVACGSGSADNDQDASATKANVVAFSYSDPVSSVATQYVASLSFVSLPTIGLNPIVFTLQENQDMITLVPVSDATVILDPQMPSMGHGSPGSINPTPTSPGLYEGKLSFSMTGTWQTTVTVREGAITLGAPIFTTTF